MQLKLFHCFQRRGFQPQRAPNASEFLMEFFFFHFLLLLLLQTLRSWFDCASWFNCNNYYKTIF